MKKILFCAKNLDYGGIEKSLVNWLCQMDLSNYQIDLLLEEKSGAFLNEIPENVHIIKYYSWSSKNKWLAKILKKFTLFYWTRKLKGKYDFTCSYVPYMYDFSTIAYRICSNSAILGHTNYLRNYHFDKEKTKWYFETFHYLKYKYAIFVSKEGKQVYDEIFPTIKNSYYCPNLLNSEQVLKGAKEKIETLKKPYFINVSRHEEESKKISLIIKACALLKKEKIPFQLYLIGDGPNHEQYQMQVKQLCLNEEIHFLGYKKNPYPYIQGAIASVISSSYEGGPISAYESLMLKVPVITTKVGTIQEDLKQNGILVEQSALAISNAMKKMLHQKYVIEPLDTETYNEKIKQFYQNIIEGRNI